MQRKITALNLILCLSLSACSHFPGVYKPVIQQGNQIEARKVRLLKPGMTKAQVRYVMGTNILTETFNPNRWDYVYSIKNHGKAPEQQAVSIYFKNQQVVRVVQR